MSAMTKVTCLSCNKEMRLESTKKDWVKGKLTEVVVTIFRCILCNYAVTITAEVKNEM